MDSPEFFIRCYHLISWSFKKTPIISLKELSSLMNLSLFFIHRKFAKFGIDTGKAGVGFKHKPLREKFGIVLGFKCRIAVIGHGVIGQELLRSRWLNNNYEIAGLFDFNPEIIGSATDNRIYEDASSLPDAIRERNIDIVAITEARHTDKISALLKDTGIKGVWNLSPKHIEIPGIMTEDIFNGLMRLSFHAANSKKKEIQDEQE